MKKTPRSIAAAASLLACAGAHAGPFILAGTDADDHGSFSAGANQDGWFFMQRAIENIGAGVTNGNKTVYVLGSTNGTGAGDAYDAATSAFTQSTLVAAGWTIAYVDGAPRSPPPAGRCRRCGPDHDGLGQQRRRRHHRGRVDRRRRQRTFLNNFVGAGGGLFSQANGYDWLSALLPSVTAVDLQSTAWR